MLKLKILSIGKTKEQWLIEAVNEYMKRLQPSIKVESLWAKDDVQLIEWTHKEPYFIALDPAGRLMNSPDLSSFLQRRWEEGGSRLTCVIGGPEGLPEEIRKRGELLSLSPLTFTHQITRLLLFEQIYRALEIQKKSNYHK